MNSGKQVQRRDAGGAACAQRRVDILLEDEKKRVYAYTSHRKMTGIFMTKVTETCVAYRERHFGTNILSLNYKLIRKPIEKEQKNTVNC